MKELICTVCPNGCHLTVDEENGYTVRGNRCPRGENFAKTELLNPKRVVTSTVRLENAALRRLPVKTSEAVDKNLIFDVMTILDGVTVKAPVRAGDVILSDILKTGVSVIACRTVEN